MVSVARCTGRTRARCVPNAWTYAGRAKAVAPSHPYVGTDMRHPRLIRPVQRATRDHRGPIVVLVIHAKRRSAGSVYLP